MDDTRPSTETTKLNSDCLQHRHWQATLNLVFAKQNKRSYLAKNLHLGPLVLQKSLHPEGEEVCHGVIIHPPGGVAGGDALSLYVDVSEAAHALLTTPGAGKWYKANGGKASQDLHFNVQENACLEWMPQENILFDGAQVDFSADVNLANRAQYAAWEILCFGRQAQQERWQSGGLKQALTIRREGRLIWNERSCLSPDHRLLSSLVGLHGHVVSASFVVAAGALPTAVLEASRALQPKHALDIHAKYAVTALPEIFSARYVGHSAQAARAYFEELWMILRPWYAKREVVRPRIWNT